MGCTRFKEVRKVRMSSASDHAVADSCMYNILNPVKMLDR